MKTSSVIKLQCLTFKIFKEIGLPIPQKVLFDETSGKGTVRYLVKHDVEEFKDLFMTRFPDSLMDHNKSTITKDFY